MKRIGGVICSLATMFLLSSCAAKNLTFTWKDVTYQSGPTNKVFVIGAFTEAAIRRPFEEEVVRQLKTQGTEAIASYTVFPVDRVPKPDALVALMKEQGADVVMVTSLRGRDRAGMCVREVYDGTNLGFVETWREYYAEGFTVLPLNSWVRDRYMLDSALFEVNGNWMIWRAGAGAVVEGPVVQAFEPLIRSIVSQLRSDRMIR